MDLALGGCRRKKLRFKNRPVSLDSSVIDRCLKMCCRAKPGSTRGAIKVHTLLDHGSCLPSFCIVMAGKRADEAVLQRFKLQSEKNLRNCRG